MKYLKILDETVPAACWLGYLYPSPLESYLADGASIECHAGPVCSRDRLWKDERIHWSGSLPEELQLRGGCTLTRRGSWGEVWCVPDGAWTACSRPWRAFRGGWAGKPFLPRGSRDGGGASREDLFKHQLLDTQPAGRKGVGSMLKARFL